MTTGLWFILIFLICQRIVELVIAKSNEKWMKQRGAFETGQKHYKWFVIVHCLFFLSLILEVFNNPDDITPPIALLFVFGITQLFRVWCITSLGRYWNTKIIVLPEAEIVTRGPYRFIKHPNYLIVGVELFVIPLIFEAYITSILFPILHLVLMKIRIPTEEKALLKLYVEK
nr:isoprenylcysteine carboxylmethyltransferase family protein [Aquibacillus saliphilus]